MTNRRFYLLNEGLAGGAKVKVYPITGRSVREFANIEEASDNPDFTKELMKKHVEVVDHGVFYESDEQLFDKILSSDSDLILAALMSTTHGPELEIPLECACGTQAIKTRWQTKVVFHKLPLTRWPEDILLSLKASDHTLVTDVLFLPIKYSLKAVNDLEDKPSLMEDDHEKKCKALAQAIREIDGNPDREYILEWLMDSTARELGTLVAEILQKFQVANLPRSVERRCPQCKLMHEVELPFGLSSTQGLTADTSANPKYTAMLRGHAGSCIFQALKSIEKLLEASTKQEKAGPTG